MWLLSERLGGGKVERGRLVDHNLFTIENVSSRVFGSTLGTATFPKFAYFIAGGAGQYYPSNIYPRNVPSTNLITQYNVAVKIVMKNQQTCNDLHCFQWTTNNDAKITATKTYIQIQKGQNRIKWNTSNGLILDGFLNDGAIIPTNLINMESEGAFVCVKLMFEF